MTRRTRLLALVAVPALALAACTSNDAKRSDVVDAMSDAGLTDDQAACVGDGFEAAFGDDQELFNDVAAAADTDEFPEGTEDQVREIIDGCVNGEGDGGTETTGATDGTETTETTATTAG
ncbi:MAG TPA: hypothetical protein VFI47_17425 [Acidimicrobiales bacterium]|nr:hypothetical protein [Acidimicrobiales bacterium]